MRTMKGGSVVVGILVCVLEVSFVLEVGSKSLHKSQYLSHIHTRARTHLVAGKL